MKKYIIAISIAACALPAASVFAVGPGNPAYNVVSVTHDWTFNNTSTDIVGGNDIFTTLGTPAFTAISNVYPFSRHYKGNSSDADEAHGTTDSFNAISFWVKADNIATTTTVIYNEGSGGAHNEITINASGTVDAKLYFPGTGSTDYLSDISNVVDDGWHNVIINRDSSSSMLLIYIDGILSGTPGLTAGVDMSFTSGGKLFGSSPSGFILQDFASFSDTLSPFDIAYLSGGGPQPNPSCDTVSAVTLLRPTNGSTITNDFPAWLVSNPGLLEGCNYQVRVNYSPEIGSVTAGSDIASWRTDPTSDPSSTLIGKSINLWNYYNATTTAIDYTVQLQDSVNGIVLGSEQGNFYLAFTSSSLLTAPIGFDPTKRCGGTCQGFGTVGGGSISTVSSTIAATGNACSPPADWTDIGGGIAFGFCTTLNYLFVPNASTNGIISGDMTILETVPPFSWFFAENAALAGVAAGPGGSATYFIGGNTSSTSFTPDNGVSFVIYPGINGATSSMTLLPADLTSNGFLADGRLVDDYYNLILTFIICIAIIMVYKIVL